LEVEFGGLEVLEVELVPGECEEGGDEFELEEEVDAGFVAAVYQFDYSCFDAVLEVVAGGLQEVQVDIKREF
jgi:hypothetical protein